MVREEGGPGSGIITALVDYYYRNKLHHKGRLPSSENHITPLLI